MDLLKRENFDDPKIQGYLEILEAKSQRLKTLTEDVVEASKVSSGNITLEMMDVNLVEMTNQTIGEFQRRWEAKKLTVVAALPEEPGDHPCGMEEECGVYWKIFSTTPPNMRCRERGFMWI